MYFPDSFAYTNTQIRGTQPYKIAATLNNQYTLFFNDTVIAEVILLEIIDNFTFVFLRQNVYQEGLYRENPTQKFIMNLDKVDKSFRLSQHLRMGVE